jgi:hypothetical protein
MGMLRTKNLLKPSEELEQVIIPLARVETLASARNIRSLVKGRMEGE